MTVMTAETPCVRVVPICCRRCLLCQAEKLVAKLDALGATAGDLGLSLFKVAKFEVRACSHPGLLLHKRAARCAL